jgi:hypothetical protein
MKERRSVKEKNNNKNTANAHNAVVLQVDVQQLPIANAPQIVAKAI